MAQWGGTREDRNTKIWISGVWKDTFRWNKKHS